MQALIGVGGLDSGTSFPGSPESGETYYRTDLGFLFYYTGAEWRSPVQSISAGDDNEAPDDGDGSFMTMRTDMTYAVHKLMLTTKVSDTNNSNSYWSFEINSCDEDFDGDTEHYAFDTSEDDADEWVHRFVSPNSAAPGANNTFLAWHIESVDPPAGSPGEINYIFTVYYYWIAT